MGGMRRFVLLSLALGAVGLVGLAVPAAAQQTTPVTSPAYPPSAPVIDPCVANPNSCQVASPGAPQVSPAAAGKLAFTGSSSTFPFAEAGIGLVLVGGVLAVAMRRRRSAHTLKI